MTIAGGWNRESAEQPDTREGSIAASTLREATGAHSGTDAIIELLTAGQGEMDPLAALVDMLEAIDSKLTAITAHLGIAIEPTDGAM